MTASMHKKLVLLMALSAGVFVSCGPKDADKIGEAQLCLDKATQGTAAACTEKIAGVESKSAYGIRCSAGFIDEGFTQPARFKQAYDALSQNGSSSTEAFMGVLAFNSKATPDLNVAFATATFNDCSKSGGKGLILLGSMASTATTLSKIAGTFVGGAQPTPSQIEAAINTAKSDPAAKAAIGAAVAVTYTSSCLNGSQADKGICDQMGTALATVDLNDPAAVGQAILNYWSSN
jgi:hypothetical protein